VYLLEHVDPFLGQNLFSLTTLKTAVTSPPTGQEVLNTYPHTQKKQKDPSRTWICVSLPSYRRDFQANTPRPRAPQPAPRNLTQPGRYGPEHLCPSSLQKYRWQRPHQWYMSKHKASPKSKRQTRPSLPFSSQWHTLSPNVETFLQRM